MEKRFDTFIFDLDGTLLDTVPDLIALTNRILAEMGMPERSREDIISFVGGGLRQFLALALPSDSGERDVDRALDLWNEWYTGYYEATDPYDGIPELLAAFSERECRYAVFSNRDKEGVELLIEKSPISGFELLLGTGVNEGVEGEIRRKPEPDGVIVAMELLGSSPNRTLYIGDTPSDIAAGRGAGCATAAVLWGYHSEAELLAEHPDIVVSSPMELLRFAD